MSSVRVPAMTAFVEATAGIMRLTTPVKTKHMALCEGVAQRELVNELQKQVFVFSTENQFKTQFYSCLTGEMHKGKVLGSGIPSARTGLPNSTGIFIQLSLLSPSKQHSTHPNIQQDFLGI